MGLRRANVYRRLSVMPVHCVSIRSIRALRCTLSIRYPSGHLIVSCAGTNPFRLYDPRTGDHRLLVDTGCTGAEDDATRFRSNRFFALVVVDHERCAYIADYDLGGILHTTLPAHLFFGS